MQITYANTIPKNLNHLKSTYCVFVGAKQMFGFDTGNVRF